MAISRESFQKGKFTSKAEANNKADHPIMKYLRKNHRNAFTVKEIQKAVPLSDAGVRGMLRHLVKAGLVEHRSPYFIARVNGKKNKKR